MFFLLLALLCSGVLCEDFISTPGVVKRDPGTTAVMTWKLSRCFDPKTFFATLSIYKITTGKKIVDYVDNYEKCNVFGDYRIDCILPKTTGFNVGFTIRNIRETDASQYRLDLRYDGKSDIIRDTKAYIYVFRPPSVEISGNYETREGSIINLTCTRSSQSVPASLRNTAIMEYNWTINNPENNHVVNGNQVIIQTSKRNNQGATFTSVANEQGSSQTNSDTVMLNILHAPDAVHINKSNLIVTEGDHVTIECLSKCNPACSFTWTRQNDNKWRTNNHLLIFPNISRKYDDLYMCEAENRYGRSTETVKMNVNFPPEIKSFVISSLENIVQGRNLSLTCQVSSKPKADIKIINRNTSVDMTSVEDASKAVYTFINIHVLDSAIYQCVTNNNIKSMPEVSRQITLDVKGGFMFCEKAATEEGVALHANLTVEFCLNANPFTNITNNNWKFVSNNSSQVTQSLPDGVSTSVQDTSHMYKKYVMLRITKVLQGHYGTYILNVKNTYNTDDLIHVFSLVPEVSQERRLSVSVIVGVVLGILVAVGLIVILVVLWRRGILSKISGKTNNKKSSVLNTTANEVNSGLCAVSEPSYQTVELSAIQQTQIISAYEALSQPAVTEFSSSSIKLVSVLNSGDFYKSWSGKLLTKNNPPLNVIAKQATTSNDVFHEYLKGQALSMTKLRSSDHTVVVLGMSKDHMLLILEHASFGNLKQYLKSITASNYYNVGTSSNMKIKMNFIQQIINGIKDVFLLEPPSLFYCLSASNVLVFNESQCKVSGFSTSTAVTRREKWEEQHKIKRPVKWLSPEAITLNHVKQSDIWSLGILMWQILNNGKSPIEDKTDEEARQLILEGQRPRKTPHCSSEIYNLMCSCWMFQPRSRPSVGEIQEKFLDLSLYEPV